ncbi:MAG TPA: hypothetical protein VEH77_00555, partial [Roseiarcus sp.]|nr:hypothetical protein [Roseiarcus sp.]
VTVVPNRGSPPAVLLRESCREGDKVRNRTIANLSKWPPDKVEALRAVLRGEKLAQAGEGLEIIRAIPHGHVMAAIGTMKRIGLDTLLPAAPKRKRDLALALIVARLIDPESKLATARALDEETASHSLGALLRLGRVSANEVYEARDWLGEQQARIEKALARRHLSEGTLVLYDLTSTYLEGRCCSLARRGYSRDRRGDKLQIVFGVPRQSARGGSRRRRDGARLQRPRPRRAGLPLHQDRRHRSPPGLPLGRRPRSRPCLPLHAGLLPRMAHAPSPRADPVRRP